MADNGLPTRPTKTTDKRNAAFLAAFGSSECVELDALPPDKLKEWVTRDIERHIDLVSWVRVWQAERAQQDSLSHFIATFDNLPAE